MAPTHSKPTGFNKVVLTVLFYASIITLFLTIFRPDIFSLADWWVRPAFLLMAGGGALGPSFIFWGYKKSVYGILLAGDVLLLSYVVGSVIVHLIKAAGY